ncbi:MAG TPA: PEP-CTERM sorting domain-containing protein [Fimbriiglobus sp.]|jgi:hypothetical protein
MGRDWIKRTVISATAFGVGAYTLSSPAYGFFPPVVSTEGTVSVLKPPVIPPLPPTVIPPVTPPVTPPVVPPCSCVPPGPTVTPQGVPEPATLVSAALGLVTLAGARLRKKNS